jgi:hypothetical protein
MRVGHALRVFFAFLYSFPVLSSFLFGHVLLPVMDHLPPFTKATFVDAKGFIVGQTFHAVKDVAAEITKLPHDVGIRVQFNHSHIDRVPAVSSSFLTYTTDILDTYTRTSDDATKCVVISIRCLSNTDKCVMACGETPPLCYLKKPKTMGKGADSLKLCGHCDTNLTENPAHTHACPCGMAGPLDVGHFQCTWAARVVVCGPNLEYYVWLDGPNNSGCPHLGAVSAYPRRMRDKDQNNGRASKTKILFYGIFNE